MLSTSQIAYLGGGQVNCFTVEIQYLEKYAQGGAEARGDARRPVPVGSVVYLTPSGSSALGCFESLT